MNKFTVQDEAEDRHSLFMEVEREEYSIPVLWAHDNRKECKRAATALNAEWNRRTGGWVSVEDELPEAYQDVLVWEEHSGRDYVLSWYEPACGWWKRTPDVTHWMPLPEPPKPPAPPEQELPFDLEQFLESASPIELKEYINVLEKVLAERTRLLETVPECPNHGKHCVPYAIEWVEWQKKHTSPETLESRS